MRLQLYATTQLKFFGLFCCLPWLLPIGTQFNYPDIACWPMYFSLQNSLIPIQTFVNVLLMIILFGCEMIFLALLFEIKDVSFWGREEDEVSQGR